MAGSFPNVPSRRMALHDDGTVGVRSSGGFPTGSNVMTAISQTQMDVMSAEDVAGSGPSITNTGPFAAFIFPELREIDGVYACMDDGGTFGDPMYVSADTTNGASGTWTSVGSSLGVVNALLPDYRDSILSLAESSKRGIRTNVTGVSGGGGTLDRWHIYGEISPGETPDRLLFIDEATGLEFVLSQDYGDVPRGSSEDIEWRIKNNSASLTANTIQYTAADLFNGSGGWYTFTLPAGSSYASTQQIASLAAATTTGLIKTRRITDAGADMSLHAARQFLNTASWS